MSGDRQMTAERPMSGDRPVTGDHRMRGLVWIEPSPAERSVTIPDVWQWKYPQLMELWRQAGAVDEIGTAAPPG